MDWRMKSIETVAGAAEGRAVHGGGVFWKAISPRRTLVLAVRMDHAPPTSRPISRVWSVNVYLRLYFSTAPQQEWKEGNGRVDAGQHDERSLIALPRCILPTRLWKAGKVGLGVEDACSALHTIRLPSTLRPPRYCLTFSILLSRPIIARRISSADRDTSMRLRDRTATSTAASAASS